MIKVLLDVIFNIILPFGIILVSYALNIEESLASLFITLIPIVILSFSYYSNKPSIYIKILTIIKCRSNVKLNFKYYSELGFTNGYNFKKLVDDYCCAMKKYSPARITKYQEGEYCYQASINVDSVIYEFNYNPEYEEFNFYIDTKISLGLFIKEIKKIAKVFDEVSRINNGVSFCNNISDIKISFINTYDNSDIRNPFMYRMYNDFSVIRTILEYKTKRNTIVILDNNNISYKSKNNILDFIEDVKKQMSLLG
ncbi:hypothetical protein [Clostridium sp.]|uniref:hypothetical protein n=1 Tax=Clostridium sp. TaxID=1506 RepID=UPI001D579BBC|nr:hypothetical protein [Clostridium sp.]MBS5986461.1 hypothetical protein [Clostridium sp.]